MRVSQVKQFVRYRRVSCRTIQVQLSLDLFHQFRNYHAPALLPRAHGCRVRARRAPWLPVRPRSPARRERSSAECPLHIAQSDRANHTLRPMGALDRRGGTSHTRPHRVTARRRVLDVYYHPCMLRRMRGRTARLPLRGWRARAPRAASRRASVGVHEVPEVVGDRKVGVLVVGVHLERRHPRTARLRARGKRGSCARVTKARV